ncbi:MAG: twin-arginine translocation signal domain-containing protein [Candidatus Electrothrix sp. AR3]|nr:twin-arginine translocation signal domain-containing protein [Candidatus Electrothrix sp. AR3]
MLDFDRRNFLKTTAVAASAVAVSSAAPAFAAKSAPPLGVVYTKDQQGQWEGKAGSHAPEVRVEGGTITVLTAHPMTEAHFIVRHTVVLADGTVIGGKTFSPTDKATSSFKLPKDYKGKVCATSFCNKHDFWVTHFTV